MFIVQTLTSPHPFFHRDLAKDGNFVGTTMFGSAVGVLLFSTSALLPSFMQNLLGYSALQSGWASMPRGLGSLISFLLVPTVIARLGPRIALSSGVVLCVFSLWQMSVFNLSMTPEPIMLAGFIQGLGTGLMFAPLNTLGYATLDPVHRTEGTIVATMARSLGSSVGISVVQALVIRDGATAHARLAEKITSGDPLVRSLLPPGMDPSTPFGATVLNGEVTRQGSMVSYDNVFSWMALAVMLLIPLILFLKPAPRIPQERELVAD
jgi:DHA2 family multidrug resistance protein